MRGVLYFIACSILFIYLFSSCAAKSENARYKVRTDFECYNVISYKDGGHGCIVITVEGDGDEALKEILLCGTFTVETI